MRSLWLITLVGCAGSSGVLPTPAGPVQLIDVGVEERRCLAETLDALSSLPADEDPGAVDPHFRRVFGFDFSGPRLLEWWRAHIVRIELGDPWTVAVYDRPKGMIVGPGFCPLPLSQRLGILIHEARHADPGGHPHGPCPPPLQALGDDACDPLPLGAYTFQAVFLRALAQRGLISPDSAERGAREAELRVPHL
ncbi:MAG: hypothetical protein IPG45_25145 [Deltaproteobacteria bacterium]|jgi:hypothetical protein|nr:hypothetical protein [Deltaproteobacteria bacterium]